MLKLFLPEGGKQCVLKLQLPEGDQYTARNRTLTVHCKRSTVTQSMGLNTLYAHLWVVTSLLFALQHQAEAYLIPSCLLLD